MSEPIPFNCRFELSGQLFLLPSEPMHVIEHGSIVVFLFAITVGQEALLNGNLFGYSKDDGKRIWQARFADFSNPPDHITSVRLNGAKLAATSFGGCVYDVDPATGAWSFVKWTK